MNSIQRTRTLVRMADETTRLWKARRTILEMLQDRKYNIAAYDLSESLDLFRARMGPDADATIYVKGLADENEQMYVFFPPDRNLGVKPIRKFHDRMRDRGVQKAIIVYLESITPFARKACESEKFNMQLFEISEVLVNITKHKFVPKHVVLDETEKQAVLEKYKVKITQLPRMQPDDPVARYFGLKPGQVVKIIRPSETAGKYVTYRAVL